MMDTTRLKMILGRFKISDYTYIIENWQPLSKSITDVDFSNIKKTEFIEMVMAKFKHKEIRPSAIAQLDLLYIQKYPTSKLWKVLKVDPIPDSHPEDIGTLASFQKKLKKEIMSYLNARVDCVEHHHTYWIRIAIEDDRTRPSVVYIIHLPNTNYLMLTTVKAKYKGYILQSLMMVLNGHAITDAHLSGHCLMSLMRLVLSKHSQGAKLSLGGSPRPVTDETLLDNVYNENHAQKRVRDNFVAENYGPAKLPRLEKIVYKTETKFRGSSLPALSDRLFHCDVKFYGPSILEGIRSLASAGLAELPMKSHLAQLHKMAMNEFYIKPKSK